jgi:hypothetical protein
MSATKSAKKFAKTQATKAKAKTKPAPKKAAAKEEPQPTIDECLKGGKHVWKDDGDGKPYCEKCFEPAPKGTKAKVVNADTTTTDGNLTIVQVEPARVETFGNIPAPVKPAKAKKAAKEQAPKKLSAIDAAAKVLAETGEAMNCVSLIEAMATKGYWTSPGGKTPHATLYSAILREVATKGKEARFVKTERGKFVANATA